MNRPNCPMLLIVGAVVFLIVGVLIKGALAQDTLPLAFYDEYDVIETRSKSELVGAVNSAIGDGWQPVGGVSNAEGRYVQAIVR